MEPTRLTSQAVVYARISPRPTHVENGERKARSDTIDAQIAACRAYCQKQGWEIAGEYEDVLRSGGDSARPGFRSALELACQLPGVLVTHSMSRATRSLRHLLEISEQLGRHGARLYCLTGLNADPTTPEGRMTMAVLAAVDEFERELVAERTRYWTGKEGVHRKSGRYCGGRVPFGKRREGKFLVDDPQELPILSLIASLRDAGLGAYQIAERLNNENYPARGTRWHPTAVTRILKSLPVIQLPAC